MGAEQSLRSARRAGAPLRPYLPCGGSSQVSGDSARPFLRTHWARGSETHPLPSPGHAFSRGSRGDGPSGQVRSCSPSPRYLSALNKGDMGSPSRRGGRHNLGGRREDFRGKGRTQRDSGVLTGTSPSLADPYPGCFALTARAGQSRATSQSSVPLRDPLKCLCVMRRQGSAAELEGGLSLFKCVEPKRLEQLETASRGGSRRTGIASGRWLCLLPFEPFTCSASHPNPPISDFFMDS